MISEKFKVPIKITLQRWFQLEIREPAFCVPMSVNHCLKATPRRRCDLLGEAVPIWPRKEQDFDEMAKYDLPASIDFIVKQTRQEEIFYVGHSQGTTIGFITFSTIPKIAERIKIFFALAPVFSTKYLKSPLVRMTYKWKSIVKAFSGNKEFLPKTSFKKFVGSKLCPLQIFDKICLNILFMMFGYDSKNLNIRLDVYFSHNPAGTSVQSMLHWSQLLNSTHLKTYDWGSPDLNLVHYNQRTFLLVTLLGKPPGLKAPHLSQQLEQALQCPHKCPRRPASGRG
ncbi:hypothetical protein H8959_011354 [Pygathrix nigripes]